MILLISNISLYSFQTESPSGSELNALGIYLLSSLIFVVGALMEFAAVILLSRFPKRKLNNVGHAIIGGETLRNNLKLASQNSIKLDKLAIQILKEKSSSRPKTKNEICVTSIHMVDFLAFWLFLFFYMLFNCIYWTYYSM